jgi:hypothetical protein
VYQQPGDYVAQLTVTSGRDFPEGREKNENECVYYDTTAVTIGPPYAPLQASAGGPYTGTVGSPVTFTATTGGSAPVADSDYRWNFGDGSIGTGQTAFHTYISPGTFTLNLTAAAGGQSVSAQASVLIAPVPTARAPHTPSRPAPDVTVRFTPPPTPSTASPVGQTVTYAAGWNLIAGPQGMHFSQADGPLYTFRPGDADYDVVDSSTTALTGYGYWAYFDQPTPVTLSGASVDSASVHILGGHFVLLGNPSATATVTIHDAAYAVGWNSQSNSYEPVTSLAPGQSAWVYVTRDDVVTVGPGFPTN